MRLNRQRLPVGKEESLSLNRGASSFCSLSHTIGSCPKILISSEICTLTSSVFRGYELALIAESNCICSVGTTGTPLPAARSGHAGFPHLDASQRNEQWPFRGHFKTPARVCPSRPDRKQKASCLPRGLPHTVAEQGLWPPPANSQYLISTPAF